MCNAWTSPAFLVRRTDTILPLVCVIRSLVALTFEPAEMSSAWQTMRRKEVKDVVYVRDRMS